MNLVGRVLGGVLAVLLVGYFGLYRGCFATTNLIGSLGMDKDGRQVLIQSLDAAMGPGVTVESEFSDRSFLGRALHEPMRTTLRLRVVESKVPFDRATVLASLQEPATLILAQFETIELNDRQAVKSSDILRVLEKRGTTTLEDFYAGCGFTTYEVYDRDELVVRHMLRGVRNDRFLGE